MQCDLYLNYIYIMIILTQLSIQTPEIPPSHHHAGIPIQILEVDIGHIRKDDITDGTKLLVSPVSYPKTTQLISPY